jgi:hypothetical protein
VVTLKERIAQLENYERLNFINDSRGLTIKHTVEDTYIELLKAIKRNGTSDMFNHWRVLYPNTYLVMNKLFQDEDLK